MLAGETIDTNGMGFGDNKPAGASGEAKGSLADRIRALQTRASRVQQPN